MKYVALKQIDLFMFSSQGKKIFFSMKGVVFEVYGLTNKKYLHLNGRRGIIQNIKSKDPLKYVVTIDDDTTIVIKNENILKVYCLGIPKEYRLGDQETELFQFFLATLSQTKSVSFYVFVKKENDKKSVFLVNTKFFNMALEKMTTEPLLRIYSTSTSHTDDNAAIIFDQCCKNPSTDMSYPWFIDLSSTQLLQLISRFESIEDENELKKLNIHDVKDGMFKYNS